MPTSTVSCANCSGQSRGAPRGKPPGPGERAPADRRRQLVALTPEGERLQRHLFEVAQRSQDQFLGCLTFDERATLSDLLRRVLAAGDRASEDPASGDPAP